jgi:predicted signal transduction protein with EAL and GGDEF domain
VTRHGGDEFVIVLPDIDSLEPATELARRLMDAIAQPFYLEGHALRVTSSIGISVCPDHGTGVGKLLSNADLAMYAAKRHGKNTYRVFEERLLQRSTARLNLENGLRVALHEDQLSLVFQPKVNLATRQVDAVEALLRWTDPREGPIAPDRFIPVAEDCGLIIEIGDWVLRQSLAAAQALQTELGRSVAIAVNVSPVQFRSPALMTTLRQLHAQTPNLAALLEIELTETALAGDIEDVVSKLRALHDMGLKVAIDDFGTGYSSLAYLKNFPIDILKIDQAFIRALTESPQDRAIVTSVVQLGRSLGFQTVAEGVEQAEHARILQELGCDLAQGYWFARPQPLQSLVQTIRSMPSAGR